MMKITGFNLRLIKMKRISGYQLLILGLAGLILSACLPSQSVSTTEQANTLGPSASVLPIDTTTPLPTDTPTSTSTLTPTPNLLATQEQRLKIATMTANARFQATLAAPSSWSLVFRDTFDSNERSWPSGSRSSQRSLTNWIIKDGKYRSEIEAYRASLTTSNPSMEELTDFYLTTDILVIDVPISASYGVFFRKSGDNYYVFYVYYEKYFSVRMLYQGEWIDLVEASYSDAIRVGRVNRLSVSGEGAHFVFFINGDFVAEMDDSRLKSGKAGLAIALDYAGDRAEIEFDNFEIREFVPDQAICPNGAPAGHWILYVVKSGPENETILIDGKQRIIHPGKNNFYLLSDVNHSIQIGSNTISSNTPECGENTVELP